MSIAIDTNILVRVITEDDPEQARRAQAELAYADRIIVPTHVLCEVLWLLSGRYEHSRSELIAVVQTILSTGKMLIDRDAIEAGLALLRAGGDFADGVIAHQGLTAGADAFVSFDVRAIRLLNQQGLPARLPA